MIKACGADIDMFNLVYSHVKGIDDYGLAFHSAIKSRFLAVASGRRSDIVIQLVHMSNLVYLAISIALEYDWPEMMVTLCNLVDVDVELISVNLPNQHHSLTYLTQIGVRVNPPTVDPPPVDEIVIIEPHLDDPFSVAF